MLGGALAIAPAIVLAGATSVAAQARSSATAALPTFSKDVAPILQRSCQRCHHPGSIGPMPLLTFEEARPWARAIKTQVVSRAMPPWHIDRTIGIQKFLDDPSLGDAEISTIARWVDGGAPRGNPADMPAPIQWASDDRWNIGTPDLILNLKGGDVKIPAAGADQWINYDLEDAGLTEDRYIKAIEIKPTKGTPTVHHANASYEVELPDGTTQGAHLVEYAVGKGGEIYPEGSGKVLKAGSRLRMNLHQHSVGEEMPMNAALGLKFYPAGQVPKFVQLTRHVGDQEEAIDIPAGQSNARSEGFTILQQPTLLSAFQPHMHNRGKRQCLEAIYPPTPGGGGSGVGGSDRARIETISCADFHFAWHLQYTYAPDVQPLLPKGTVLRVVSWHDNSAANKYNPDPSNWVGFGQRTIDDMAFAWVTVHYMTEDEYQQAVKDRQRARSTGNTQQQQ
jgi:hypothetical protein